MWPTVLMPVRAPLEVQPVSEPVSNPPLVTAEVPDAAVTAIVKIVVCVAEVDVPVTVTG